MEQKKKKSPWFRYFVLAESKPKTASELYAMEQRERLREIANKSKRKMRNML